MLRVIDQIGDFKMPQLQRQRRLFFSIDNKKSIQGLILHKIGMIAVNMRYITAIDP